MIKVTLEIQGQGALLYRDLNSFPRSYFYISIQICRSVTAN